MNNVIFDAVYYVHTEGREPAVNPIGIRPHIGQDMAWWNDTTPGRGRSFKITKVDANQGDGPPKEIDIMTSDGKKISLTYMTLDVYNKKVRDKVVGKLKFNTDQEVQEYYLNTDFSL